MKIKCGFLAGFALLVMSMHVMAGTIWLDTLEMTQAVQPWGSPQRNLSVDRRPLSIGGKQYRTGVGMQSPSRMWIALGRGANTFRAEVGVDDSSGGGTAQFVIAID